MLEVSLFELFTLPLLKAKIKHCITGSVASMLYGEPRLTHDIDIVVGILEIKDIRTLHDIFPSSQFYVPPEEVVRVESAREYRGHFNIIHLDSGYKADMYLEGEDPFHRWALKNARSVNLGPHSLLVAPPEYVIVRKLQFFKEGHSDKHVQDIRAILKNPALTLQQNDIERWSELLGVSQEWKHVLSAKPG
jgi:hypothetical protein